MSMMRRLPVRDDRRRKIILARICRTGALDTDYGRHLMDAGLKARTQDLDLRFTAVLRTCTNAHALQKDTSAQFNRVLAPLKKVLRLFIQGLKQNGAANELSVAYLALFDLNGGKAPSPTARQDWVELAEFLVEREQLAVSKGFPAMIQPSVDGLAQLLTPADEACRNENAAALELVSARADLKQIREEINQLINEVAAYLNYKLKYMKPSQRRDIMRRYGFSFQGDPKPEPEASST